jgi:hypothetical protein
MRSPIHAKICTPGARI